MLNLPKIAIIGRPNVGKSSLLNSLAGRRVSIVGPTAGITRDRVAYEIEVPPPKRGEPPRHCELIDTGGYGIYSGQEKLSLIRAEVERQINVAIDEAALILFVFDAQEGVTPLDKEFANVLRRRLGDLSRVMVLANKVDAASHVFLADEGYTLGFGQPFPISATTGTGKVELLETISQRIDFSAAVAPPRTELLLAIVGKRNAGKSTLVNALAGSERVIASELPGTTRDSIDVRFEMDGQHFTAIDTAGVRKRKSLADDVEYYSLHRALRAVRRADVCMLLIDATVPVSQVDKKLAHEITEQYKPCVIVVNKWDLVADKLSPDDYPEYLGKMLKGLTYAPIAFICAKTGEGVKEAVQMALNLHHQAQKHVGTGELNRVFQDILNERGPSSKLGSAAKIYYVTQPATSPPTLAMFVNKPDMFDNSYQRYLLNQLRARGLFEEVPIKLIVRERRREFRPPGSQ
jgi:GTP-binding protein